MIIKSFVTLFFFLFATLLCCEAKERNTDELPRKNAPAPLLQTDEIVMAGQKRYRILTEHYDITATRLEEGQRVAERLEHLVRVWKLLGGELMNETEKKPALRHRAILYRDKQEYTLHLYRIDPHIARTNGFYHPQSKTAFFFSPEAKVLFHEGTHQILAERFFHEKRPAFRNNFWVIEGMALFMETLKIEDEWYQIGDILANRLYSAKKYRFEQGHKLPIQKLTAMSQAEIQRQSDADLQRIYSQSATLVHWLMFAEEGRYRPALFELLRQTYHDSATAHSLSKLTGLSYEELDEKYEAFLKTVPE